MAENVTVTHEPIVLEAGEDDTFPSLQSDAMQIALLDGSSVRFAWNGGTTTVTEQDARQFLTPERIRGEIASREKMIGVLREELERLRRDRDRWMDVGIHAWPGEKF